MLNIAAMFGCLLGFQFSFLFTSPNTFFTRRIVSLKVLVLICVAGLVVAGGSIFYGMITHRAYIYQEHFDSINSVAWSPDGTRIASGSNDGTVQVWNSSTGKTLLIYQFNDPNALPNIPSNYCSQGGLYTAGVTSLAWSPDGGRIASGNEPGTVLIWDSITGKTLLTYRGHSDGVTSIAWSPDKGRIASGSCDKTVQVWDSITGKTLLTYRGHHEAVNAVAWSPDGMHIASGGVVLHIWDSFSGENDYSPDSAGDVVNTLAWSPDGIHIAVAIDEVNTAYISPRDQMNIQAMVKILLVP
jgi:WD40 repeat protein